MKLSVTHTSPLGLSLLVGSLVFSSSLFTIRGVRAAPRERYLEVRQVSGQVTSQGRPVKVGDRLREASSISTSLGSSAVLVIDDGIGTIKVSPSTNLQVRSLRTLPDGSKRTRLYMNQGQTSSNVRPFKNRRSSYEIETPGGVAGTRGTEFGVTVTPRGKTGLSIIKGTIALTSQGKTILVQQGYSSLIIPGEVPELPKLTPIDTRVRVQMLSGSDRGQVRVVGFVDPINLVSINDRIVDTGQYGKLDTLVPLTPDRLVTLVVRTPLGNQQVYELEVPQEDTLRVNTPTE